MPEFFGIQTEHPATFELLPGASHKIEFRVTNNQTSFRNLGFRATPLKPDEEENPAAPETAWLRVEPPPSSLVQSGGEVACAVEVTVPETVAPGHEVRFALVVYDSDLSGSDEVKNQSTPFTLKVAGESVVDPPPPPPVKMPPWWAFMPAVGIAVVYLVIVAISQSGQNREALVLIPLILTIVGAIALIISSAIIGRKKSPIDVASYNYGWTAMAVSAVFLAFMLVFAFVAAAKADDVEAGGVVLVMVLLALCATPLALSILVIKRQSAPRVTPPP